MSRFGETKEKPIKIWNANVENIAISKLVKTKTNSKYCIGYLDWFCLKWVDMLRHLKLK